MTSPAVAVATLVCNAPTCGHRGSFVQIHADTVLPVHCGGCGGVLHCQHDWATDDEGPTHADALVYAVTTCTRCRTVDGRVPREATDAELAGLLPAGLRVALQRLT